MSEPPDVALYRQSEDKSLVQLPGHGDCQAETSGKVGSGCTQLQLQCNMSYQSKQIVTLSTPGLNLKEYKPMRPSREGCPEKGNFELALVMKGKARRADFSFLKMC